MPAPPQLTVKIGGQEVKAEEVFEIVVDLDLDQPDMASVVLSNVSASASAKLTQGDPVEVSATDGPIFKGEIIGIEPVYDRDAPSRCTVRALNRLHRLSRGRKSKTFENMSDQDIVNQVCQAASLSAKSDTDVQITYDHVYQHNQTDLEFIRQRAARIGYEVVVDDTTLNFRKKKTSEDSGVELKLVGEGASLERFRPRLSSANQTKKVIVRGWDPVKKKEIVGTAEADAALGDKHGPAAAQLSAIETVETDQPIFSTEQANAIAKAQLREKLMGYIQGDALCQGTPKLKPGLVVKITVEDPRFDGKYYVASCRHRYVHSTGGLGGLAHREAGFRTFLKVLRDAMSEASADAGADKDAQKDETAQDTAAAGGTDAGQESSGTLTRDDEDTDTGFEGGDDEAKEAADEAAEEAAEKAEAEKQAAEDAAEEAKAEAEAAKEAAKEAEEAKEKAEKAKNFADELNRLAEQAQRLYTEAQALARKAQDAVRNLENLQDTLMSKAEAYVDGVINRAGAQVMGAATNKINSVLGPKVGAAVDGLVKSGVQEGEAKAKDGVHEGAQEVKDSKVYTEVKDELHKDGEKVVEVAQDIEAPAKAVDPLIRKEEIKIENTLDKGIDKAADEVKKEAEKVVGKPADKPVDQGAASAKKAEHTEVEKAGDKVEQAIADFTKPPGDGK